MVKLSWIFLLSVVAVSTVKLTSCLTISSFTVKDLENTDDCFIPEALNWYASVSRSTIYTKCGETYLLGGYGVLGNDITQYNASFTRTYGRDGIPTHTMVYFTMRIWAIDNWQFGDFPFILQIGSRNFTPFSYPTFLISTSFPSNHCGAGYNDLPDIRIFGRAFHQGFPISITLISQFSENSQSRSFGFRDLSLIFATPSPLLSETMCGKTIISLESLQCPCNVGQYVSSGLCVSCDPSCASCFGSGSNQCYECNTGYYHNGINCMRCDASCSTCDGPSPSDCRSCRTGSYLFNTICVNCSPPLTIIPANNCIAAYCQNPCPIFEFLYWDQTCEATCPSPLQIATLQGLYPYTVKACTFPCSSDQYLYWDGTCKARCSLPLSSRIIKNLNFCEYLCNKNEYLYPDGSCISGCVAPFVAVKDGGKNFCYQESKSSISIMIFSTVGGGIGIILVIAVTIKFTKKRTLQVQPGQEKENLDNSAQALAVNQSSDLPPILSRIEFASIMQLQKVNEEEGNMKVDITLNEQSIMH